MRQVQKLFVVLLLAVASGTTASAQIYVEIRPSRPVYVQPVAPGPGYVWIEEDWASDGGRYAWRGGHWAEPRPGYSYRSGHWNHSKRGHVWVNGNWRSQQGYRSNGHHHNKGKGNGHGKGHGKGNGNGHRK